jgi:hypothetical protein
MLFTDRPRAVPRSGGVGGCRIEAFFGLTILSRQLKKAYTRKYGKNKIRASPHSHKAS